MSLTSNLEELEYEKNVRTDLDNFGLILTDLTQLLVANPLERTIYAKRIALKLHRLHSF